MEKIVSGQSERSWWLDCHVGEAEKKGGGSISRRLLTFGMLLLPDVLIWLALFINDGCIDLVQGAE